MWFWVARVGLVALAYAGAIRVQLIQRGALPPTTLNRTLSDMRAALRVAAPGRRVNFDLEKRVRTRADEAILEANVIVATTVGGLPF